MNGSATKQTKGITAGYWIATSLFSLQMGFTDDASKWSWAAGTAVLWALSYFFFRKRTHGEDPAMRVARPTP